jgi:predicted transcriptional regulator
MTDNADAAVMELAAEIVVAYLTTRSIEPEGVPKFIREVGAALRVVGRLDSAASRSTDETAGETAKHLEVAAPTLQVVAKAEAHGPAVPIDQSVFSDHLVSLEDGGHYRSLRRHLMAKYGMTPDDYRRKWGLPDDYPMVAPDYAKQRSDVARRIGLGKGSRPTVKTTRR